MPKYWVIVANANHCRIFQCSDFAKEFSFVDELLHDQSKLKNGDLVSDRFGSFKSSASNAAAYTEMTDPKEYEKIEFARQLANNLDSARSINGFDNLILIAPPHFLGLLGKQLNKNTNRLVSANVTKDYTEYKENDISSFLHGNWREIIPL